MHAYTNKHPSQAGFTTKHLWPILVLCLLTAMAGGTARSSSVGLAPVPAEVRSSHFTVSINGRRTPVLRAASHYYLLNFDIDGPATVSVTADDPHFWDRGVEVQPMRHGIRPQRHGATITFPIPGPIKLSLARPGEHFADSEMLFLFGNPPAPVNLIARTPGLIYIGPGTHRQSIDARSGDRIYLAPGAVVFGSLNLWQVHDVRVFGTGTIVYDGPQNPHNDDSWFQQPNWHCIVMKDATAIEIDGITCITRSRTWQVQMKDSRRIGFYNVKIIGGTPDNANQDGIDWLGGGDTTVSNSFFRSSDDTFAMYGNWDGYEPALLTKPGADVTNISITDTIASTSISNTVRVGWPQKTFNNAHFHMSDMDVIHSGFGGCKVPFAFFELWADPDGHGTHTDFRFNNIRLEDWYSLFLIEQSAPHTEGIAFDGVWALDGPAMLPPVIKGDVHDVTLHDTTLAGVAGAATTVLDGASAPSVQPGDGLAAFTYSAGALQPHAAVQFTVQAEEQASRRFEWSFGDGTRAVGRTVTHRFPDAQGTLLDGSGRFRVLLHVRDGAREAWGSQAVVVGKPLPAVTTALQEEAQAGQKDRVIDANFDVPADGGYSFTLLTSTAASLRLDDRAPVHSPPPQAQVCGSVGDAVQPTRVSAVLQKGTHHLHIVRSEATENAEDPAGKPSDQPVVLWEGPGLPRQVLPVAAP